VDGCMEHRLNVGEVIMERKYMGRDHYWTVYDMQSCAETGGFAGAFLCKVQSCGGQLTNESRLKLFTAGNTESAQREAVQP
jgi:hypothetical protein